MYPQNQNRNFSILVGIVALVVVIGIGFIIWRHALNAVPGSAATTTSSGLPTTSASSGASTTVNGVTGTGTFVVTKTTLAAAPDFKSALVCASTTPASQCAHYQAEFSTIVSVLAKKPTDAASWIYLGMIRKEAGDYQGAIAAWNYMTRLYPTNAIAFNNLGDLYMNFVHDYPKAESNYLHAIKNKSDDPNPYRSLFELYTQTSYRPSASAAEDILKRGIAANPRAIDLKVLLARLYKSKGRTTDASAEYDVAFASAKSQGNTTLANQIQAEKMGSSQ